MHFILRCSFEILQTLSQHEQQADRLLSRGLCGDRTTLISYLQSVGYYRLSGYWRPFQNPDPANPSGRLDSFRAGATVEQVWQRYVFDRQLRLLVMDAIERLEVDARGRLTYLHAQRYGPFGYADDPATLPCLSSEDRDKFLEYARCQYATSSEEFVKHFHGKYGGDHKDLPIWIACEVMTFGNLLTFNRGCAPDLQKQLAARYQVSDRVCLSWLRTLNAVRNICAHHSRLWNRELGLKPLLPNKDKRWDTPIPIPNNRLFGVLTICRHCLQIVAPDNTWSARLQKLLSDHPNVPITGLGMFNGWEHHPLWAT